MDAEPPSKRRREDELCMDDLEDWVDDDEPIFQLFENEAKVDSGYRFSIERAYSDHRFQATMAHIFEKYGRNFEGIGDEIDLMTGEIVVDNGHIRNMRNEGDIGDDFMQVGEEEDMGILLEELTDGENDQVGQDKENAESELEQGSDEQLPQDEHNKDPSMHDYQSPHNSMALVARPPVESLEGSWGRQTGSMPSAFWPSLYGPSPFGFGFGFGFGPGASSMTFDPSPLVFGASPFPTAPWDLPSLPFEPQWAYPQAQQAQSAFAGHRYNFKAQRGQSSIWARRSRYKEDEDEPLRSVFDIALSKNSCQANPHPRKSLPAPAAVQMPSGDDEDDDEAILSGKSVGGIVPSQKKIADLSDIRDDGQDDEAGLLPFDSTITKKQKRGQKRRRKSTQDIHSSANGLTVDFSISPGISHEESEAEVDHSQPTDGVDGRRHSSQIRKQLESSNRILGHEALEGKRFHVMRVELPSMSQHCRDEYQAIEVIDIFENDLVSVDGDGKPSVPMTKSSPTQESVSKAATNGLGKKLVNDIGDDEQKVLVHTSGQSPGHALERDKSSEGNPLGDGDSVFIHSNDEAPPMPAKSKISGRGEKTRSARKRHLRRSSGANNPAVESRTDDEEEAERQEILESSIDRFDAYSEPNDVGGHPDDRMEGSDPDPIVQHESTQSGSVLVPPSEYSGEAMPFSSSPTRSLANFTARVSLNDTPNRLLRETRWLRKRASTPSPARPAHNETPNSQTTRETLPTRRGRGRPGKWIDTVKQAKLIDNGVDKHADSPTSSFTTGNSAQKSRRGRRASIKKFPEQITDDTTVSSTRKPVEDSQIEAMLASSHQGYTPFQSSPQHETLHETLPTKPNESPSPSPKNLKTPRHRQNHSTKSPSSRRSILSLVSNNADNEEIDELRRTLAAMPGELHSSGARSMSARKIWKSSTLTTEIYHTPIKKRPNDPLSPGSLVMTPGGTVRTCGLNGYRCGRDFCFTCL